MVGRRGELDPVLALVRGAREARARGRLTIFFGAAPRVGKTYAMLEAAHLEVRRGRREVVVAVLDSRDDRDTLARLAGLELLACRRSVDGEALNGELDLDAVLARRPQLVVLDGLAHTNAPGARHVHRWQDVEELVDSGIDVFTTLNVGQLESLSELAPTMAGVRADQTIPDAVFDTAHEVRLVDLPAGARPDPPDFGDILPPVSGDAASAVALHEGNVLVLRELALRRTTERVQAKLRGFRAAHGMAASQADERVLVCVTSGPGSARLIRAARRMATSLNAGLLGVHVETSAAVRLSVSDRKRLSAHLRLVESLGGEAALVRSENAAVGSIRYARDRNVTKIVVGKPAHPRWQDFWGRSFVGDVVRESGDIDVYVISGHPPDGAEYAAPYRDRPPLRAPAASGYAAGIVVVFTAALVSWFVFGHSQLADVAMVFLLGVIVVSMRFGYGPSLLAAVLSVAAFEFFFIPPYFSFAVANLRHIVTFAVMFFVAFVVSHLTKRIRDQADAARDGERRTASLFVMSREIGLAHSRDALLGAAARQVREVFGARVALLLPGATGRLEFALADPDAVTACSAEIAIAQWSWLHERRAGASTETSPTARALYVPLKGSRGCAGVLALLPLDPERMRDPDDRQLLETFAGLLGSALERTQLVDEARSARLRIETEQLRNALLSSVSHDLRTPLGVVTGATSALLERDGPKDRRSRRRLLETAHAEALRLNRLVANLLEMTRLEAGALRVRKELQPLEEVVGAALTRLEDRLHGREVGTGIPGDLPLVAFDSVLIEQVVINLVENATKYTPPGSPIDIGARLRDGSVETEVADRGPGISPGDADRVFDKFYRVQEREGGGAGLGLTICRGIVNAHGGRIWVESRQGGGASFRFTLPLDLVHTAALRAESNLPDARAR